MHSGFGAVGIPGRAAKKFVMELLKLNRAWNGCFACLGEENLSWLIVVTLPRRIHLQIRECVTLVRVMGVILAVAGWVCWGAPRTDL